MIQQPLLRSPYRPSSLSAVKAQNGYIVESPYRGTFVFEKKEAALDFIAKEIDAQPPSIEEMYGMPTTAAVLG